MGAGYRPEEYEQFDLNIKRRPSLMEDGVEVLKQAWTGEPFEWRGHEVRILPRPAQEPRPAIALGGSSPAVARSAPRASPTTSSPWARSSTTSTSRSSPRSASRHPNRGAAGRGGGGMFFHIAEDPDRAWTQIAPARDARDQRLRRRGHQGCAVRRTSSFDSADELRKSGMYEIVTPDAAVDLIRERGGVTSNR